MMYCAGQVGFWTARKIAQSFPNFLGGDVKAGQ